MRGRKRNKVFQFIGFNDGASQEHLLQNTLILRGQEAVRIMLKGFLCLTQPAFTRRPWRGNALPRRPVGALLYFDIILTASKPLRTADFASYAPARLLFVAVSRDFCYFYLI